MHKWAGWLSAALAFGALGCGDGLFGSRTIEPKRTVTHVHAGGKTELEKSLQPEEISVLVFKDGEFAKHEATSKDGNVVVEDVPRGTYYLRYHRGPDFLPIYVVTEDGHVDLSDLELGRPDKETVAEGTTVSVNASALGPWDDAQEIQVISPNVDLFGFAAQWALLEPPNDGAPTGTLTFDYSMLQEEAPRVVAAAGDDLYVSRMKVETFAGPDGPETYNGLDLALHSTSVTVTSSGATSVAGEFTQPSASATLMVDWRREAFDAMATQVHPDGKPLADSLFVFTQPYGTEDTGVFSATADLAFAMPANPGNLTVPLSWRNPYPAEWLDAAVMGHYTRALFTASTGETLSAVAAHEEAFDVSGGSVTVEPTISPPQNVAINGSGNSSESTANATPHLSWTAPSIGKPAYYYVIVVRVARGMNGVVRTREARILTKNIELDIPPDVLQPGSRYVFIVGALAAEGASVEKPFRSSARWASAEALSGLVLVE